MKKGLLISTTLAMLLGVGVAVGAHQAKEVKEVKAAGSTLYLDTNKLTWYGNLSRAHLFGSGGNNGWPGEELTHVSGSIYSLSIPDTSKYQNVIFLRSDGTNVWNRTSKDGGTAINLPSDWSKQNMWTFGDGWNGNEYDDGNYTGSWSLYTPPAAEYSVDVYVDGVKRGTEQIGEGLLPDEPAAVYGKSFSGWFDNEACSVGHEVTGITGPGSVYCKMNNVPTVTYTIDDSSVEYSALKLYAFEPTGKANADWPGADVVGKSITVPNDATLVINDGTKQTVNVEQSKVANDTLKILAAVDGEGHNTYVWGSEMPVGGEGYYIKGSASEWAYVSANKMSTSEVREGYVAQFIGFTAKADDEIRVVSYYTDRTPFEQWSDLKDGKSDVGTLVGDNLKFTADGEYDVYAKYESEHFVFEVNEHVEPQPDPVYTVVNLFQEPVQFVLDEEDKPAGVKHQYSAEIDYACRGRQMKFYADGVEITSGIGVDWDTEHDKPVEGNNIHGDVTNGFYLAHTANYFGKTKIYLKTYEDGGLSLWGAGYENNTFTSYIDDGLGGGKRVYYTLDEDFVPDENYIRQYKTSAPVALKALSGLDEYNSFDLDSAGLSESVEPEAGATNNARTAYQSSAWTVHNDCEEVIYIKERKTDLSLVIYVGGFEEAHVLTIGGKEVHMVKDGNQYKATGVALTAGDEVTGYTIEGVAQTVTAEVVGNNNLNGNKKVLISGTFDIYYHPENSTLWISGVPEGGYHLYLNDNSVVQMTPTEDSGDYKQYKTSSYSFKVGDVIKVLDANGAAGEQGPVVWALTKISEYGLYENFEVVDGVIKCKTACSSQVYLKILSGQDEIYFGEREEYIEEAVEYVNKFKSDMSTVCTDSPNKQANVEAGWSKLAGDFAKLSKDAQDAVKLGGYSDVAEIREFGERYIAIKQQHADWDLANFLNWDIPAGSYYSGLPEFDNNNSAFIVVAVIASIATLSTAVLLVIKKRKRQ